jgi:hypothetical protein
MILGGRTQISAMIDAEPSLVSAWIGNNDALSAALAGDTLALTPVADFQAEFDELVAGILETGAEDAILIGAADAAMIAPALQPGAYFWAVAQAPPPGLPPLAVSDNCAPFTPTGPNPTAFQHLISFAGVAQAIATSAFPITIDCQQGVRWNHPEFGPQWGFLLDVAERTAIAQRVGTFNAYIQQQASANGWIYLDPTQSFFPPALNDPSQVKKCQLLPTATDAASFMAAVQSSCPVDLGGNFFGSFFSHDGVHPSGAAHVVIADTLARRLNDKHGLGLPLSQ